MEPEDQSRHSKTKPEPVTIDLGTDEVTDMAAGDPEGTEDNVTADADPAPAADSDRAPAADTASASKSYSGIPNANSSAASQPQPTVVKSAGSLPLIAAGLIGGLIALGGAAGLQYWGVLPSLGSNEETQLALNTVSSDVEKLKTDVASQPESISRRSMPRSRRSKRR